MRVSEFFDYVGHPLAYYPPLAEPFSSAIAALLALIDRRRAIGVGRRAR